MFLLMLQLLAGDLSDYFPTTPPAPEAAAAHAAALLGPPATIYDAVTATPGAATPMERGVEEVLAARLRPAPDSLRRWGRFMLAMSKDGPVPENLQWFAAEHAGLPTLPLVLSSFVSGGNAESIAQMLSSGMSVEGLELRSLAVVVEPLDNGVRGMVVGISQAATFDRFPRVWSPGDAVSVPGTLLEKDKRYALFVAGEGPTVDVYELPASEGAFDVDIPMPAQSGVWSVAMSGTERRRLPDSAFFFRLYVGQQPPTAPPVVPAAPAGLEPDEAFLAAVNAERAKFGFPALKPVGDPKRIRSFLESLPEGEVARYRAWKEFGKVDLLPEVQHGSWRPVSGEGVDAAQAAWTVTHNPVFREAALDPAAELILLGSSPVGNSRDYLGVVYHAPAGVEELRKQTYASLDGRFQSPAPAHAASFQATLDAIAARVASGELPAANAMKEVQKVVQAGQKSGALQGSVWMTVFVWDAGQVYDAARLTPPPTSRAISLGVATGNMGRKDGLTAAVGVLVTADSIK